MTSVKLINSDTEARGVAFPSLKLNSKRGSRHSAIFIEFNLKASGIFGRKRDRVPELRRVPSIAPLNLITTADCVYGPESPLEGRKGRREYAVGSTRPN